MWGPLNVNIAQISMAFHGFIVDFRLLFKARFPSLLSTCQLRFQIRNLGGNFATKFASSFQSSNFDCKQM
jgi:hypothetical protein